MEKADEFTKRLIEEGLGCVHCPYTQQRQYTFNGIKFTFVGNPQMGGRAFAGEAALRFIRAYEIKEELGLLTDLERANLPVMKMATTSLLSFYWLKGEGFTEIRVDGEKRHGTRWAFLQGTTEVSGTWNTHMMDARSRELGEAMKHVDKLWVESHHRSEGCNEPTHWLSGEGTMRDTAKT